MNIFVFPAQNCYTVFTKHSQVGMPEQRDTSVTKHSEKYERKSKPAKHFWVPQKRRITHMSASSFSYFIWNSVLKYWAVNWTTTQTSKKTSIINIDVSSVYLRLICIHIEKSERINCLLLRDTWLLQVLISHSDTPIYKAKKFIPSQRPSFNIEETLQKVNPVVEYLIFFSPASWDTKTIQDKKLWK